MILNQEISKEKLNKAKEIITNLQKDLKEYIKKGHGPFLAMILDENGKIISKCANSVINECCSNNHAEVNAIKEAQKQLNTYDLSKYNLSIYITAEPCIMCIGAIMWSGIKEVYFGVNSKDVEKITGFDEGFKPNWLDEFKNRKILVCGNLEEELGKEILQEYVKQGLKVYKPQR